MTASDAFYVEWAHRTASAKRSIERARLLAESLGTLQIEIPLLTVVGSKGKGTAATYASAYLAATELQVVTVTSPQLRRDTERIRLNGAALTENELAALGQRIRSAAEQLPPRQASDGYLSPSGLFTTAGLLYAKEVGADFAVLEAGMGGASDEVSIFAPTVLAMTEVFAEHVGVLGQTPVEIAVDKAGIATPRTAAVVSLPQGPPVAQAISVTVNLRTEGTTASEFIDPGSSGIPQRLLPAGIGRNNAELGCVAAQRLLHATSCVAPSGGMLNDYLATVRIPGRGTHHALPGTDTEVFADSAINRLGVTAALTQARLRWKRVDHVVVCLPDHKDVSGVIAELDGLHVTYVRLTDHPNLRFSHPIPASWEVAASNHVDRDWLAGKGKRVLAIGTVYFIGKILDLVNADTKQLFTPNR